MSEKTKTKTKIKIKKKSKLVPLLVISFSVFVTLACGGAYYLYHITNPEEIRLIAPSKLSKIELANQNEEFSSRLLKPRNDQRFLIALKYLSSFLKVPLSKDQNLDRFPSFKTSATNMLSQSQFSLNAGNKLPADIKTAVDTYEPEKIFEVLPRLNQALLGSADDLESFKQLAKATTILALHTSSYFFSNDQLVGKALALNRILEQFCGTDCYEEMALDALLIKDSERALGFYVLSHPTVTTF